MSLQRRLRMHCQLFFSASGLNAAGRLGLLGLTMAVLLGLPIHVQAQAQSDAQADGHTQAQPRYTVSTGQLQQMVAQRFPLRYPVAGLVNLDVQPPLLRLLPEHNRLSALMAVDAHGPALVRNQKGTLEVDFALRYEASDRSVRATQLRFKQLRMTGLEPAAQELLKLYGPPMAEQTLQEVVLHQLRPQDLAMMDALGLQPSSITVTDDGLVIGFALKPWE
jgi:hypothetical protein